MFWCRKTLYRMYLTIPVTSATSERVFSALRRLKNYPRSTLSHCHKSFTDTLDTVNIACANEQRKGHFEKFEKGCTYGWVEDESPPHPTFQNAPPPLFRAATAKTSDRKACVIMHVQSVQSNVLLVKTHCLNFLTFLKLPDVINRTDISLLFIALLIVT